MTPAELRAAGTLYGKAAECFLGMAQALEQNDLERHEELAMDLTKVMVAMLQITSALRDQPTPELEEAWRTLGRMGGWTLIPDKPPAEPAVIDENQISIMEIEQLYRDR